MRSTSTIVVMMLKTSETRPRILVIVCFFDSVTIFMVNIITCLKKEYLEFIIEVLV